MSLRVVDPGLYTTVQDEGRFGYGRFGVSRSGAMDLDSLRLANRLAGNNRQAAGLEMTATGVTIKAQRRCLLSLSGPGWSMYFDDGRVVKSPGAGHLDIGQKIQVRRENEGVFRAYLAVRGGVDVPSVMGSRSTDSRAEFGGVDGKKLNGGEALPVGHQVSVEPVLGRVDKDIIPDPLRQLMDDQHTRKKRVRVILGPHEDYFETDEIESFLNAEYKVSPNSNRVGYRLSGTPIYPHADSLLSEGVIPGAVQVPTGGKPILLMADCQTMGGYPVICTVVSVDLNVVGRCAPGDVLEFSALSADEAAQLRVEHQEAWETLQMQL